MPFSEDHRAISETVSAWSQGANPDGRTAPGESMPPDLFSRVLKGELDPHTAAAMMRERAPSQNAFNDQIRRQARGRGFVGDAEQLMAQAGSDGSAGAPAVRNTETGKFANLGEAARDAGHKVIPNGLASREPATEGANDRIKQAFYRARQQRGGG